METIHKIIMIDKQQILLAKKEAASKSFEQRNVFVKLASLNLLNAAVKKPEFKYVVKYQSFKPLTTQLLESILQSRELSETVEYISINPTEKCAYIKCNTLQFSFHNLSNTPTLQEYQQSAENIIMEWEGVRLQNIAEEIFNLAIEWKHGLIDEKRLINRISLLKQAKTSNTQTKHGQLNPCCYFGSVYSSEYSLNKISQLIIANSDNSKVTLLRNFSIDSLMNHFKRRDRNIIGIMMKQSNRGIELFSFEPKMDGTVRANTLNNLESGSSIEILSNAKFEELLEKMMDSN